MLSVVASEEEGEQAADSQGNTAKAVSSPAATPGRSRGMLFTRRFGVLRPYPYSGLLPPNPLSPSNFLSSFGRISYTEY